MLTPPLPLTSSWKEDNLILERHIRQLAVPGRVLQILEAGCGRAWTLDLTDIDYELTGLDLDEEALRLRKLQRKDLHRAIVGDLRTASLDNGSFDVVFSAFVLEHIEGAEGVLRNFVGWLRPGGVLVLRLPDPESVAGLIARATPHWFHVFYYRYVLRNPNAGKPGFAPYPTVYDAVLRRSNMAEFFRANNLTLLAEYGDGYVRPGAGAARWLITAIKATVNILSLGHFSSRHTNLLYVARKAGEAPSPT